jgi:hypothetical protein
MGNQVAPYCMNAKRRALELEKSAAEYSSRCKEFGDSIETIRKRIRAPRKISAFQCFCGHEKAANQAA